MRPIGVVSMLLLPLFVAFTLEGRAGGIIKGRVVDRETKEPLVGANIVILGSSFGAVADPQGEFSIFNVPVDVHTLRASYVGYTALTIENVRVNNDLTTEVEFTLASEAVQMQAVTIEAERPLVLKSATNAVRILTSEEISSLPVRGLDNIIALQAGVVRQDGVTHVRGGREDEVGFYLEGISVTDPHMGGRGVAIVQDAVEEVSLQSAGYEAEYGRANSGIIQYQLRSGGPDLKATAEYVTDNITFQPRSRAFSGQQRLGAYWYGYNEFTGTLGGPFLWQNVRFFGMFNYFYKRDVYPQSYPGINVGPVSDPNSGDSINFVYPAGPHLRNSSEGYISTGTLTMDLKPLMLRFSGSYYSGLLFNGADPMYFLDIERVGQTRFKDWFASAKATYFLGPASYLELGGGFFHNGYVTADPILGDNFFAYGDSVANAQAGVIWQRRVNDMGGRYALPRSIDIFGFYFPAPGAPVSGYVKSARENISLNAAFATQIGKVHSIKLGGDFQRFTTRIYQPGNVTQLAGLIDANNKLPADDPLKVTMEDIMRTRGTNNYGYDLLGAQYDGNDFMGPRHPLFASAYIQDKMEFSDLVINAGLRYDYMNSNAYTLADPTHPDSTFNFVTGVVNPAWLRKATPYHSVSPRLGLGFPVTDRTVFHVQYSKLIQASRLRDVNVGIYTFGAMIAGGTSTYPIGLDLRPTRTTQYEIGFTQQIGEFASFDVTGYYKDIKDQIVMDLMRSATGSAVGSYAIFVNGDYATTKGVELTFTMRRTNRMQGSASLSIQDARGSGSYPNSNWAIVTGTSNPDFRPQYIAPLAYESAIRGNVNLDYRFPPSEASVLLRELGASLLLTFNSGHPYTRSATPVSGRFAVEPVNSSTTPWVFQLDLRVDKTIRLSERLGATLYLYVINVLDARNIENVFTATGSPSDDGFLSNPETGGKLVQQYGKIYEDIYRGYYLDYGVPSWFSPLFFGQSPHFYGPPRQLRLGIKMEY